MVGVAFIMYQDNQDMQNSLFSSFAADHQMTKTMIGLPSLLQVLVMVSIFYSTAHFYIL